MRRRKRLDPQEQCQQGSGVRTRVGDGEEVWEWKSTEPSLPSRRGLTRGPQKADLPVGQVCGQRRQPQQALWVEGSFLERLALEKITGFWPGAGLVTCQGLRGTNPHRGGSAAHPERGLFLP